MDRTFIPLNLDSEIHRRRRNLPHWEQPGRTYFVTFRTADSLPQAKLDELNKEKEIWHEEHPEPWDENEWEEYNRRFTERMQAWLDNGFGACLLRRTELNELVAQALLHFDSQRYVIDEFVVMPNHIHAILKPDDEWSLESILHSWKSYTSNQINEVANQAGRLWMDENFDHAVRSQEQLDKFRRYIRDNPVKAGLKDGEFCFGRGVGLI